MKKVFIVGFILFIVLSLFFQKKYLANLKKQSHNMVSSGKAIIGQAYDFKTFFYNNDGSLKTTLSGQKIVYYEDASFFAEGHLLYQSYNAQSQPVAVIQTEFGNGEFEVPQDKNALLFSGNKQLKWLKLPQNVSFNFNGNQGTTKNVFIDAQKRTISSNEHISSKGPSGTISANGFFYDVDKKEFKFNSKVNGTFKPSQNSTK